MIAINIKKTPELIDNSDPIPKELDYNRPLEEFPARHYEEKPTFEDRAFVTVKKGDTLSSIAKKHGTKAETLAKANPHLTHQVHGGRPRDVQGNKIYPGDEVVIAKPVKNKQIGWHVEWTERRMEFGPPGTTSEVHSSGTVVPDVDKRCGENAKAVKPGTFSEEAKADPKNYLCVSNFELGINRFK